VNGKQVRRWDNEILELGIRLISQLKDDMYIGCVVRFVIRNTKKMLECFINHNWEFPRNFERIRFFIPTYLRMVALSVLKLLRTYLALLFRSLNQNKFITTCQPIKAPHPLLHSQPTQSLAQTQKPVSSHTPP
jgi:hypothetical protein